MKNLLPIFVTACISLILSGQEKPPEIMDDYAWINAGDTISVNVMQNDWCMEGHEMSILNLWQGEGGTSVLYDSTITYHSYYYFKGTDTVRYMLIDNDNGLFSEQGNFVIHVENEGRNSLEINNIEATFNSFGYLFCTLPGHKQGYIVPRGSDLITIFCQSLWLGGYDEDEQLHVSGERYRMFGTDYYPGPVSVIFENQQILEWNFVNRLSWNELVYHDLHWQDPDYELPTGIERWPANGDESLGQHSVLAPYFDRNNNELYDPENGDRPLIRGDQAIYIVYNESMKPHTETGGEALGVEIHLMAYAYDLPDDSIFNNTIFVNFTIINRSDHTYHDFYIGNFVDFDLGNPWDDFVGCDTTRQCYFVYNGDDNDESQSIFQTNGYGLNPPAQAVVHLNHDLFSFIVTNNYNAVTGDPSDPQGYINVLTGSWRDGQPLTYGGQGFGGDSIVRFQYPGDPVTQQGWSEITAANNPGDRRGIASSGPFTFNPGDTLSLDLAYVFARDFSGNHLNSLELLKSRIDDLRWYYDNDSLPHRETWSGSNPVDPEQHVISIFPNPCGNYFNVRLQPYTVRGHCRVYDLTGSELKSFLLMGKNERVNVSNLKSGIYIVKIESPAAVFTGKFIKK